MCAKSALSYHLYLLISTFISRRYLTHNDVLKHKLSDKYAWELMRKRNQFIDQ